MFQFCAHCSKPPVATKADSPLGASRPRVCLLSATVALSHLACSYNSLCAQVDKISHPYEARLGAKSCSDVFTRFTRKSKWLLSVYLTALFQRSAVLSSAATTGVGKSLVRSSSGHGCASAGPEKPTAQSRVARQQPRLHESWRKVADIYGVQIWNHDALANCTLAKTGLAYYQV